jgi:hypothetical protein
VAVFLISTDPTRHVTCRQAAPVERSGGDGWRVRVVEGWTREKAAGAAGIPFGYGSGRVIARLCVGRSTRVVAAVALTRLRLRLRMLATIGRQ